MKRFQSPTSHQVEKIDNINMANILMLFSRSGRSEGMHHNRTRAERVFECKTCNRQFPSYQALGGHTASHKKPRLLENEKANGGIESNKPKTHECSICGLEFAIGQALGGHMRRHRAVNEGFGISSDKFVEQKCNSGKMAVLDLNFPPMDDEVEYGKLGLGLGLIVR